MAFSPGATPFGVFDNDAQFQVDADRVVDYVRQKLGDPVMYVHLSSSQVYMSFEEACLEFSAVVNQYQAKSALARYLGMNPGGLSGSENKYPPALLEFQKRQADAFGNEAKVNSTQPTYSGSIQMVAGVAKYDLQHELSGTVGSSRVTLRDLYYYSPLQAYRFFGTTSAINYLNNQFKFESFTPETIFYLLPIWEDILRGMQFKTSNRVRRSNYSYEIHDNVLTIYPVPTDNQTLFFTYQLPPDSTTSTGPSDSASFNGVANLSNVPFGNISYSAVNSVSKQWIWKMAAALAKEVEGQIRAKMSTIPIPNGDLTLNGPELISDAKAEQEALRQELRTLLDDMTYDKIAAREAEMAQSIEATFAKVPLGIFVG